MTRNQKAIQRLKSIDILATEENGRVYVDVADILLELSFFEVMFQARRYDEIKNEERISE